jgi:DNA polymerase-3 subunit beta
MKFIIEREQFLKPIQLVIGAIERRHNLPILANMLLKVSQNTLTLIGTDMEVELVGQVSLTQTAVDGSTTVPAKKLLDIVRSLPERSQITAEQKNNQIILSCGRSRFTLAILPEVDYPHFDHWVADVEFGMAASQVRCLVNATQFAMANQDVRYYLNGLLFETKEHGLRVVATDGHRLATCAVTLEGNMPEHRFILPRKGVLELMRLLEDSDELVQFALNRDTLSVKTTSMMLTCKLIDGSFPDYRRVLPRNVDKKIIINRLMFKQALARASILSNEKFRSIRIQLDMNLLRITANNPEQEQAEEVVDIDYVGSPLEIGFNVNYLIDVLNTIPGESVSLSLNDGQSSVLIEDNQEQKAMYVVMPVCL